MFLQLFPFNTEEYAAAHSIVQERYPEVSQPFPFNPAQYASAVRIRNEYLTDENSNAVATIDSVLLTAFVLAGNAHEVLAKAALLLEERVGVIFQDCAELLRITGFVGAAQLHYYATYLEPLLFFPKKFHTKLKLIT